MKDGIHTTEFWVTAISNVVLSVVMILGVRGLITAEEGDVYAQVGSTLALTIGPIVAAIINGAYIKSRTEVKKAAAASKQ